MPREFSAGGAVYKKPGSETLWLLIKPRPSEKFPTDRYQLPKGHIETGEKVAEAAVREVTEETGVTAKVLGKVCDIKYVFTLDGKRVFKVVSFFLMAAESEAGTPDSLEIAEVFWLPYEEAKTKLSFSSEKKVLEKAAEMVKSEV